MWRIWRPIHGSWRLAACCGAFVVGVALAPAIPVSGVVGLAILPLLILALLRAWLWLMVVAAIAAGILGLSYGSAHMVSRARYEQFWGSTLELTGRVKEDISKGSSGYSIQLENVFIREESLPGTVLITSRTHGDALRGDILTVYGEVGEGFGSFPATLSAQSIRQVVRREWSDPGRVVRDAFAAQVREVIPDPQASLGIGFLTGQKSALPPELADALKVAGLTHIVVASGYNLTILVRMARKLFLRASKYLSAVSAGAMIVAFVLVTGLSPSMTRAGLVSSMSLLAWYYGRAFHPFVLLPVAAATTVVLQPSYVWGDMGWQLSFSAFFGVMVVAPLLQSYLFGPKEPGVFRQVLGETVAAHIVTIPIIALSFGTVSNVAIIANLLVVPLVPLAMLLTFVCGIGAIVAVPFMEIIAVPTTWLLGYMTSLATFVADIPWAQTTLQLAPFWWLAYAGALGLGCVWGWRKTRYNFRSGEPLVS